MNQYKCLICGFKTYFLDTNAHLELHGIDINQEIKNRPKDKTGHKFVYPKRYFYKIENQDMNKDLDRLVNKNKAIYDLLGEIEK